MRRILMILSFCSCTLVHAQTTEADQLRKMVDQFFEGMLKKDTVLINSLIHPDAQDFYITDRTGKIQTGSSLVRDFNKRLVSTKATLDERARKEEVKVELHDRIATVWAPYDLWVDGKFSHCGIDVFTFFKLEDGWKMVSIIYSMEAKWCDNQER